MADIQQYSVSIKFKTEGSEATEEKVKKLQAQLDKLKGSSKKFNLGSIISSVDLSKIGATMSKVGTMVKIGAVAFSAAAVKTGKTIFNLSKNMSDYIETVNLFRASMGAAADDATAFTKRAEDELGLDPEQVMHSLAAFQNLSEGLGIANDRAYIMSKNLTQLSGDLSSFANISFQTAQQKLLSGFSGQVKPLREYGIALDQASLQELAYSLGIEQKVKTMTRAQKTELIYYQIMKSTQKMQGDLGRSLLSPANATRVLQTEFKQLARAVGSIFIPGLMRIIPVVSIVTKALTMAAEAIAKFFGFEITNYYADLSSVGNMLEGVADDIDDVGGAADGTAQKLHKMLMPFDELNNITSGTGTGGGGGAGIGEGFGGSLGIELPQYDMFASITDRWIDFVKRGDWEGLAKTLGDEINKSLSSIPWTDIQNTASQIGASIATFLNTGITSINWGLVGSSLANGINTVIAFLHSFISNFDYTETGRAVGNMINGFFGDVKWDEIGQTLSDGFIGALDFMLAATDTYDSGKVYDAIFKVFTNIDWTTLVPKLFEHIKKALGYSPIALLVKSWVKIVEAGINLVINKLNELKIPVPKFAQGLLGTDEISFDIEPVNFDVDKAFEEATEKSLSGSSYAGPLAFLPGSMAIETVKAGFKNDKEAKAAEDFMSNVNSTVKNGLQEASNNTNTFLSSINTNIHTKIGEAEKIVNDGGVAIGQNYGDGLDSKQSWISQVISGYTTTVQQGLNQGQNSKTYGENTGTGYQTGLNNKQKSITNEISTVKSKIETAWNLQSTTNGLGQNTSIGYSTGLSTQQKGITSVINNVTSTVQNGLNQSNNSTSWGSSTMTNYEKGLNNSKNPVINVINGVKSTISSTLGNSGDSTGWGSSTMTGYKNGISNSTGGLTTVINGVKSTISGAIGNFNTSYSWGTDMIGGFKKGINDAVNRSGGLIGIIKGISGTIASYLHFSRPDVGPLRDYETWMPDMVAGLSQSLTKAMPQLSNTMTAASASLMRAFTENTLPGIENFFADDNLSANVVLGIANKVSSANQDNSVSNMTAATYNAISRALAENRANGEQKIVVNVGNKTVYEGYGTYKDEQSKKLGVNI